MLLGKMMSAWVAHCDVDLAQLEKEIGLDRATLWRFRQGRSVSNSAMSRILCWSMQDNRGESALCQCKKGSSC